MTASRYPAAFVLAVLGAALAQAHFPYIVPEADGSSARVVFSDDLNPDTNVAIDKIAGTKLSVRDAAGKETLLEAKKGAGFLIIDVPGSGNRVVHGITEFGVLQKGDSKPFKLVYHPKAILGSATAKEATIGRKTPLEIVAVGAAGKVRFQVLAAGKPAADVDVSVLLPGSGKKAVKTDKSGFTPEFEGGGRYGVNAKHFEATSGDFAGKKYEEVRHYATLVCDIDK